MKFLVKLNKMNFWQFFKTCNFDFVLFWLGIWCESWVRVIMGRRGDVRTQASSCSNLHSFYCICFSETIAFKTLTMNTVCVGLIESWKLRVASLNYEPIETISKFDGRDDWTTTICLNVQGNKIVSTNKLHQIRQLISDSTTEYLNTAGLYSPISTTTLANGKTAHETSKTVICLMTITISVCMKANGYNKPRVYSLLASVEVVFPDHGVCHDHVIMHLRLTGETPPSELYDVPSQSLGVLGIRMALETLSTQIYGAGCRHTFPCDRTFWTILESEFESAQSTANLTPWSKPHVDKWSEWLFTLYFTNRLPTKRMIDPMPQLFHGLHPQHVLINLDRFTVSTFGTYSDLDSRWYFGV